MSPCVREQLELFQLEGYSWEYKYLEEKNTQSKLFFYKNHF